MGRREQRSDMSQEQEKYKGFYEQHLPTSGSDVGDRSDKTDAKTGNSMVMSSSSSSSLSSTVSESRSARIKPNKSEADAENVREGSNLGRIPYQHSSKVKENKARNRPDGSLPTSIPRATSMHEIKATEALAKASQDAHMFPTSAVLQLSQGAPDGPSNTSQNIDQPSLSKKKKKLNDMTRSNSAPTISRQRETANLKHSASRDHLSSPTSQSKANPATDAGAPTSKPTPALRRGKWTVEEETYVARVIQDFNIGFLDAPAGTTLRTYLSEKLHCDPMRITKKFTGDACIGKRVFHPAVRCAGNAAIIDKAQVS